MDLKVKKGAKGDTDIVTCKILSREPPTDAFLEDATGLAEYSKKDDEGDAVKENMEPKHGKKRKRKQ